MRTGQYEIQTFNDEAGKPRAHIICVDNGEIMFSGESYSSPRSRAASIGPFAKKHHIPVKAMRPKKAKSSPVPAFSEPVAAGTNGTKDLTAPS